MEAGALLNLTIPVHSGQHDGSHGAQERGLSLQALPWRGIRTIFQGQQVRRALPERFCSVQLPRICFAEWNCWISLALLVCSGFILQVPAEATKDGTWEEPSRLQVRLSMPGILFQLASTLRAQLIHLCEKMWHHLERWRFWVCSLRRFARALLTFSSLVEGLVFGESLSA